MAAPTYTGGSAGNALTSTSLAASGTTTFTVDVSTDFEGLLQVGGTFGTIATTAGLQVQVFPRVGSTPVNDTVASAGQFTILAVSGAQAQTIRLQPGKYSVTLKNLDATNGLTSVYATLDLIPTIA